MVGIPLTHHRRFVYEKDRHHSSRTRGWRSCHRRSCSRHRRSRGGAELHNEHHAIHEQHGNDAVDDHNPVDDSTVADTTVGFLRSSLPEHGRQIRLRVQLGFELWLGLRRRFPLRSDGSVAE
jgi:hypothetical protein